MELNLTHLFPDKMNIYGDWGNIEALKYRCRKRNITLNYTPVNSVKEFPLIDQGDIFFFGGGQDSDQVDVWNEIKAEYDIFRSKILAAVDSEKVFLLICGGYQMFGHSFIDSKGQNIPGLKILDIETKSLGPQISSRCIGNIAVKTNLDIYPKTLVGFENHGGQTHFIASPKSQVKPLGKVLHGFGNNLNSKLEGCIHKNIFGSYLHGSLLPKNPHFTDYLLKLALNKKYPDGVDMVKLDDRLEMSAHKDILKRLLPRFG